MQIILSQRELKVMDETKLKNIIENLIDTFLIAGDLSIKLRNQGLNIANALDPYMKEKLFHGRVKDLSIKAYENFYTPMGELIEKIKSLI